MDRFLRESTSLSLIAPRPAKNTKIKKKVHPAKNCWMYMTDSLSVWRQKHTHKKRGGGNIEEMNRMRETAHTHQLVFVFFSSSSFLTKKNQKERERDERGNCIVYFLRVGEMPNWKMSKDDGGLVSLSLSLWCQRNLSLSLLS